MQFKKARGRLKTRFTLFRRPLPFNRQVGSRHDTRATLPMLGLNPSYPLPLR
ncbi:type III secretion system apparatus protein YscQ/HrcQ [Neisseria bacilliformis ATCC BAA-1200]|uniref:Type III secretion system apparatus protein YscQ/HrcQ n=1 Tax=Neisseria bacilliformis ATCC BAA-1200 TaxID=888742 RepID=F2BEG3_9NEIS|nr:type III secretion system apparatus protein YscQ/HrcQ [Neisseria bacilliformis ATCC BAA-1200]